MDSSLPDFGPYRRHPHVVLAAIAAGLDDLGVPRVYLSACPRIGVLSVARGVTVWCDGRTLRWSHGGAETHWPVADAAGAASHLATLARDPVVAP
jgi:hypothetical protein